MGPIITLENEEITAFLKSKIFNLVSAIPKDIKTKKIVAYESNIVKLIKTVGGFNSKYKKPTENNMA